MHTHTSHVYIYTCIYIKDVHFYIWGGSKLSSQNAKGAAFKILSSKYILHLGPICDLSCGPPYGKLIVGLYFANKSKWGDSAESFQRQGYTVCLCRNGCGIGTLMIKIDWGLYKTGHSVWKRRCRQIFRWSELLEALVKQSHLMIWPMICKQLTMKGYYLR